MAKPDYPLSLLADNYIAYLKGNARSPHTVEGFTRVLSRFQEFVVAAGDKGVKDDLCPEVVDSYRGDLIASKYALSSVRTHIQVLKAWSAYLTEQGIFQTNPLTRRGLLPKVPKRLPKLLSDEDRDRILAHLAKPDPTSARNLAIFCLFLDTGLRVSELAGIRLDDVDFRRNGVRVRGKFGKERQVGFGRLTARYLRAYLDFHRRRVADEGVSEGYLFLCHTGHGRDGRETIGEPLSADGIQQVLRRIGKKLGVDLHPHMLRHTWATDFAKSNAGSVADLQNLLGHESPTMALYYVHITNHDAVEKQRNNSAPDRAVRRGR